VAEPKALKVDPADYKAFNDMGRMFEKVARSGQKMLSAIGVPVDDGTGQEKGPGGFPVLTRLMEGDKVTSEVELKSVDHAAVDAAVFSLPEGYKKKEMPKME
jgi:hypothetical protein